jgi:AraC-like DNA-binding protein
VNYREIIPGDRLKHYVRCYYIYESDSAVSYYDTVFPSGSMELIFNLGSGQWQTAEADEFITMPSVELWGQITKPMAIRSIGKNVMLGIRFFPFGATWFLDEALDIFNDRVTDYLQIENRNTGTLYSKLLEANGWNERIILIEEFLLSRLSGLQKNMSKSLIVSDVMIGLSEDGYPAGIGKIAPRYGITSRYLQKLFVQHTGLTPKMYSKITRFQNSLRLVSRKDSSLTSVAYECGYFDQSHFIKEFKSFTGVTPSDYAFDRSSLSLKVAG